MSDPKTPGYSINYLGPAATFSEVAAKKAQPIIAEHLYSSSGIEIDPKNIVLTMRKSGDQILADLDLHESAFAVVPISNSKLGDVFDFTRFYSCTMIDQFELNVEFWLGNKDGKEESISEVYTKNTAYEQVEEELANRLPHLKDVILVESTAAAAIKAKFHDSAAALCSINAIYENDLQPVGPMIAQRVTTFGIFKRQALRERVKASIRTRGFLNKVLRNADLYPGLAPGGGISEFASLIESETPKVLTIKWGIDPLRESLHLGHFVNLLKLQEFISYGHRVIIVLGTFTGKVGDPSGNLEQRERLESRNLELNAERIQRQISVILPDQVEFRRNDELTNSFTLDHLIKWGYKIDVGVVHQRQDFAQRAKSGMPLFLSELLYALFQAHDSIQLEVDIEVGGIDQVYNCSIVRQIMLLEGKPPQFSILHQLLPGTDGKAKMSSYKGNDILLSEPRSEIHAKLVQMGQNHPQHIFQYMKLITEISDQNIHSWEDSGQPPEDLSIKMANAVLEILPEQLASIA
jgi:tyrosyl-tRNA synthetase/prephenate dehydratase